MQKEEQRDEKQSAQFEAVVRAVVKCGCGKSSDGRGEAYTVELKRADSAPFAQRKLLETSGLGTPSSVSYHVYATKQPVVGMGLFEVFDNRRIQWLGLSAPRGETRVQFKATVLGTHDWSHLKQTSPAPSLEYGACHLVVVKRSDSGQFPGRTLFSQFTDPTHSVYAHTVPPTGPCMFEPFDDGRVRCVGPTPVEQQNEPNNAKETMEFYRDAETGRRRMRLSKAQNQFVMLAQEAIDPNQLESLKKRVTALETELWALQESTADKQEIDMEKLSTAIATAIAEIQKGLTPSSLTQRGGYSPPY